MPQDNGKAALWGFVAAYFRGRVEQLVLVLIDAQASMPFMIIALAVLAFFGNSLALFTVLMGFYGWERIARIARGLAIAATEQGFALRPASRARGWQCRPVARLRRAAPR